MKAIVIDPHERTIKEIDCKGDLESIYEHVPGARENGFDGVSLNLDQVMYVDDMGMYRPDQAFFTIGRYPTPIPGVGIIFGLNEERDNVDTVLTIEWLTTRIVWEDIEYVRMETDEGPGEWMGKPVHRITNTPIFRPKPR